MTMKDTIDYQNKKIAELERYVADLECRQDIAIDALGDLAEGMGIKTSGHTWDVAMKKLAKNQLVKIAKMQLRTPVL